ncbi:Ubiquitin like domain [Trypanosoma vivax]|uniref:Ubiquitin-like domain-containing protein n=1 Tax=Trypanosoma vivax (strain Y486) TaxID=1055687 RepID=G0TST2_TRYVY|nr:hypothetical protein TRVL_01887 [Trypanosoma vivax]KAH8605799.1 Ubiquitin like domain [Trypanosoma vivax]CCC47010.1 conserved hypothetical protein, fragment [Trypanosoma vivax Y486]
MTLTGISFLEAIRDRYGAPDDSDAYDAEAFLVGDAKLRRNKKWELVGMEKTRQKQANHSKLVHVVLRGSGVTRAESVDGELEAAALNRLEEVDLSENAQLSMHEVGLIARRLPALCVLQLSHSAELLPRVSRLRLSGALLVAPKLRKLVLHHVGLRSLWQLRSLVDLPTLEELHLDSNAISRLVLFASEEEEHESSSMANSVENVEDNDNRGWFPTVTTLSLAHNELSSWGVESGLSVAVPVAFPALTRLFLTGNRLPNLLPTKYGEEAVHHEGANARDAFAYMRPLELLCVNENPTITDPRTLDALREMCPCMHTFRITYGCLFPQWNDTLGRMFVVASLPSITTLNRGQVRPKERTDSEIFYVQRGLAAQEQEQRKEPDTEAKVANTTVLSYPLLEALREKHKDVIMAIYREGETASHDGTSHMMLHLTLRCDGFEEAKKKVPSSLTVGKLKALVRAVFSVTPDNQRLAFTTGDSGVVESPVALDNELQSLAFYGVCDGAVVIVTDTSLRR